MLNVVIGLGKTGLSCVQFCLEHGLTVAVTDSREHPPEEEALKSIAPNIPVEFGKLSPELIQSATCLIVSPGVSLREPVIASAIAKGIPYLGDIGLFVQAARAPIVAITGSNAKSTVVTLVGEMASAAGINVAVGGNLGTPALTLLKRLNVELFVLELSSFQLETTFALRAQVASILNITEDHMDRYDNLAEYVTAKQRIYDGCNIAVFNRADQNSCPHGLLSKKISFGSDCPEEENFGLIKEGNKLFLARGEAVLLEANELPLNGSHHLQNALAALAIADAAGIPLEAALRALKNFKGLPHRCQLVRARHGVHWINDSKGTNVGATVAALESFGGVDNIILIAGGDGKGADFSSLVPLIKKSVRGVILFGKDADILERAFKGASEVHRVSNLKEAVMLADRLSQSGDTVLLSPACSSLDMFKNFEYRGNEFVELVKLL